MPFVNNDPPSGSETQTWTGPNADQVNKALELNRILLHAMNHEFGYMLTCARNAVAYQAAGYRARVQHRLDEAMQGMCLVYLFALFDEQVERGICKEWLRSEEWNRLMALRHLRNGAAHGSLGLRASEAKSREAFESVMRSSEPLMGVEWDGGERVAMGPQVAHDCYQFMLGILGLLMGRLCQNKKPT